MSLFKLCAQKPDPVSKLTKLLLEVVGMICAALFENVLEVRRLYWHRLQSCFYGGHGLYLDEHLSWPERIAMEKALKVQEHLLWKDGEPYSEEFLERWNKHLREHLRKLHDGRRDELKSILAGSHQTFQKHLNVPTVSLLLQQMSLMQRQLFAHDFGLTVRIEYFDTGEIFAYIKLEKQSCEIQSHEIQGGYKRSDVIREVCDISALQITEEEKARFRRAFKKLRLEAFPDMVPQGDRGGALRKTGLKDHAGKHSSLLIMMLYLAN